MRVDLAAVPSTEQAAAYRVENGVSLRKYTGSSEQAAAYVVENKAGMTGQPEHTCRLAEARGQPGIWGVLEGESAEALGRLVSTWAAARADDGAAAVAADRRVAQSAQHAQRRVGFRRPAERAEAVRRVVLAQLALIGVLHKR